MLACVSIPNIEIILEIKHFLNRIANNWTVSLNIIAIAKHFH